MIEELLQCYNKGCGKKYKEEDNHDCKCSDKASNFVL